MTWCLNFQILDYGRKKRRFWMVIGVILVRKRCPKFFFSRRIWGGKFFPHFYPTNLAAANAAVTTKLTLIKTPYLACRSGGESIQGPCLRRDSRWRGLPVARDPGAGCAAARGGRTGEAGGRDLCLVCRLRSGGRLRPCTAPLGRYLGTVPLGTVRPDMNSCLPATKIRSRDPAVIIRK